MTFNKTIRPRRVRLAFVTKVALLSVVLSVVIVADSTVSAQSTPANAFQPWAKWRGPLGNGLAESQQPVTTWSETENVIWAAKVPGRGHSSPIISNGKIFLTTALRDTAQQMVLCFNQADGEQLWQTEVNKGGWTEKIHKKNTHASPTVACDGSRVFAVFNNHGQTQIAALDFEGNVLWKKFVADYKTKFDFGSGASPLIYGDNVLVPNEASSDCAIIALDRESGNETMRIERGSFSSYSTPVIAEVAGQTQLLTSGNEAVTGYDPESGSKLWSLPTAWLVSCGTPVWNGDMVFASGGYPVPQTIAIDAKSQTKLWDTNVKCYEQSMLAYDGRLYGLSDRGVAYCWDQKTGAELFKTRFASPVSASPVLAGGHIYFTAENGQTLVIKADSENFEQVAVNQLGNSAFASFALDQDRIYTRVGNRDGGYQETLYCIGEK